MLGLTAAASVTDAAINKKILASGNHTTLIISNDDMQDLLKKGKSLEDNGLLLDGITEIVKNEVKDQKGGFLSMYTWCKFIRKYVSRQGYYKSWRRNN